MYVHCTITMDEVDGKGHQIVASAITARVVASGVDGAALAKAAADADAGCPFSALIRASASVTVDATLEGGT
jgi:organic hydroperoxide reductase OsmC/OhrA